MSTSTDPVAAAPAVPLAADPAVIAQHLRPAVPPTRPLKIFFWAASEEDGTWIYRVKMPGEELRRLGHEVQMGMRIGAWARDEADIIVGQRVNTHGPSTLWQLMCEDRRKSGRGGMVYEVDDDLFNIDVKTNRMAAQFLDPQIRRNMIANIRAADAVTVSTEPLAAVIRQIRGRIGNRLGGGRFAQPDDVRVLPNAVRSEVLTTAPSAARADGRVFLGWQGSSTHGTDWLECKEAVADVLRADDNVYLRFLGVAYLDGMPVETGRISGAPWTTDIAQHYRRVARFSVSLAPLADTVFNASKSGLRVQESLALGVPVVASNVPAYAPWLVHGLHGFFASDRDDWTAAIRTLATNPTLRAEMGAAGREAAEAWTIEATIGGWLDMYRSLLPEGDPRA